MLTARKNVAVVVLEGVLYAIGGYSHGVDLSTVEKYDANTELWTRASPLTRCKGNVKISCYIATSHIITVHIFSH